MISKVASKDHRSSSSEWAEGSEWVSRNGRLPETGKGKGFSKYCSQGKIKDLNSNYQTQNHRISDYRKHVGNPCFPDEETEVQRVNLTDLCLAEVGV